MVGGTTNQPQQPPQLPHPSSLTAPATTPEVDELLKRNTDCVYFLASRLTCKKGSECEYRHSDIARVNPRDCWYWLNGNCLNPKCGFRHPPLDGLLGDNISTPMGASVPQLQTPVLHAPPYAMPKQAVTCIFFQKGYCLKGHLCPFLHGPPNSGTNKTTQSAPLSDPLSGPEKPIQNQKLTPHNPFEFPPPHSQSPPAKNGSGSDKKPPPNKPNRGVYHSNHLSDNHRIMNRKDADEHSREPSPGFDVLVDTEARASEYHPNEPEFRRSKGQDYDHTHEPNGPYTWPEVGLERNPNPRIDGLDRLDHFDQSDLRHRLAKQRKGTDNGFRSVGSRLRGRIKIPGRPENPNDSKFSGPKRLSELKSRKTDIQSLKKRQYPSEQSAENLSFQGPKPLSEILKRKRGATTENSNPKEKPIISVCSNKEDFEKQSGEDLIDEDAMLDQELEAYDHKNGDYDYDQIDGEDYSLDEEYVAYT